MIRARRGARLVTLRQETRRALSSKEGAMARVVDADTHIAEPPEMWDFLDPEWYPRRPVIVTLPEDTQYGASDHMWLIDGQIFPKPAGRGGNILVTPTAQSSVRNRGDNKARELLDLPM